MFKFNAKIQFFVKLVLFTLLMSQVAFALEPDVAVCIRSTTLNGMPKETAEKACAGGSCVVSMVYNSVRVETAEKACKSKDSPCVISMIYNGVPVDDAVLACNLGQCGVGWYYRGGIQAALKNCSGSVN